MQNFKSWLLLVVFSLSIPMVGIVVSILVSHGYEKKYESVIIESIKKDKGTDISNNNEILDKIKLDKVCSEKNLDQAFIDVCNEYTPMTYLGYYSALALLFAISSIALITLLSRIATKSRKALFYLFRPGLFLSQIISAVFVVSNAAIIISSLYFAEAFYIGKVHIGLMAVLGVVAAYASLIVCIKALTPIKIAETKIMGKTLSKKENPKIWEFVESITKKAGTTPPNTIIAGMEPNFFVTESKILCLDGEIKGKSLYLSLPYCRVLTKTELMAIVGHEMGHFIGDDTAWSTKFYPIYRGSIETIYTLYYSSNSEKSENNNGLIQLAFLPALHFMNFFITSFEKAEKEIGREREINADNIGVQITSPSDMARGLVKVHAYPNAWIYTQEKMKESLLEGKQLINISTFFSAICGSLPPDYLKDEVGSTKTSHPTDSHPPLSIRLASIGVGLSAIYADGLKIPTTDIAIELFGNPTKLEEELSEAEHYKFMQMGYVQKKEEPENTTSNNAETK
jgi:Zn-dependent protease with chaperone function